MNMIYYLETGPEINTLTARAQSTGIYNTFIKIANPLCTKGEILPGKVAPAIAIGRSGSATVVPMKWGFPAAGQSGRDSTILSTLSIEALRQRMKSSSEDELVRLWNTRRCVIPASWYYAITDRGRFLIQPEGEQITWMAGIYRIESGLPSFVILTRPADQFVQDQKPLLLYREAVREWISLQSDPENVMTKTHSGVICEIV